MLLGTDFNDTAKQRVTPCRRSYVGARDPGEVVALRTGPGEMAAMYSWLALCFKCGLLLVNACAILHEDRFLRKGELDSLTLCECESPRA